MIRVIFFLYVMLIINCGISTAQRPIGLNEGKAIGLPGVEGRIDHMAIDFAGNRLFVAALGNNSVEVIDLKAGKVLPQIKGMKEPQGIAILANLNQLVVACGGDGTARIYDLNSLTLLHTIENLDDADNVRYDATARRVYVGYGKGALAVIDPVSGQKLADIKLAGHPESFQVAPEGDYIYVNVPSAKQIAIVDRKKEVVLSTWPLKDAGGNFPMALDWQHRRLLVGCRSPAKLLVLDAETGKTVSAVECSGDCDDVFYDTKHRRVYLSCGQGYIDVIDQGDADRLSHAARIATATGARTCIFDAEGGTLYLAVPHRGNQRCELRIFSR